MSVFDEIKVIAIRAKKWKADGHNGEGPDGHLLRDIRGTVQSYLDDLNSTVLEAS